MKVRLTNLEYEELTKASKSSKCMSDYFRQRVFRKGVGLIDPKEFIRSMDEICLEMKRIGNNINQLARYVNIHKEEVNQEVLNEVEKKMADYVIMQDKCTGEKPGRNLIPYFSGFCRTWTIREH